MERQPGTRSDPYFKLFVNRLNQRVRQLTGSIGFFDRSSINAGDDWSDELAESLRTSKTIVCLYSPTYFFSDYCGKEMQVLLERRHEYVRVNGGKKPATIFRYFGTQRAVASQKRFRIFSTRSPILTQINMALGILETWTA